MRCKSVSGTGRVLLTVVLSGLLGLNLVAGNASDQGKAPAWQRLDEEMKAGRGATLFQIDYPMADLSLAAREQVDFLLTPALLVQEAVSEDVILTYPEE